MKKFKWVICYCCEGHGHVDNPAFTQGFTSSEWHDKDPDEQDAYMAGVYDVQCVSCKGLGRIREPDISAMNFSEKRLLVIELKEGRAEARAKAEIDAEIRAERAMGC